MAKYNRQTVRIRIVKIGLVSRVLILLAAYFLYEQGGFLSSIFRQFFYILLPLSIFYIVFFSKYIFDNAYTYAEAGQKLSKEYFSMGYYGLLLLNLAEFTIILYKATGFEPALPVQDFFLSIVGLELVFGVFAATFISDLFKQ